MITEDYRELVKAAGEFGDILLRRNNWLERWSRERHRGLYGEILHPDFDDEDPAHLSLSMDLTSGANPFTPDRALDTLATKIATLEPVEGVSYWTELRQREIHPPRRWRRPKLDPSKDWLLLDG